MRAFCTPSRLSAIACPAIELAVVSRSGLAQLISIPLQVLFCPWLRSPSHQIPWPLQVANYPGRSLEARRWVSGTRPVQVDELSRVSSQGSGISWL